MHPFQQHMQAPDAVHDIIGSAQNDLGGVIPLNPEGEELDALKQQVLLKIAAAKSKKAAKRGGAIGDGNGVAITTDTAQAVPVAKKLKGGVYPADSAVFASIFRDPTKKEPKETFLCRANAARGMKLG